MAKRLPPNTITDPVEYLLARADRSGDCWLWTGGIQPAGYGTWPRSAARRFGVSSLAHRALYQLTVGEIPDGLQLDHLCRVRRCVNPAHLEPVTNRENALRSPLTFTSQNIAKTHCAQGHPYDEANTYTRDGRRDCRTCNRAAQARRRARL